MDFKAVLFDFDGVIANSVPIYRQALMHFFHHNNVVFSEQEFEENNFAATSLDQVCKILKEKYDFEIGSEELKERTWKMQEALLKAGLESDPTLIPFLEYCRNMNIKVAIGSNSGSERISWVLKLMGIEHFFVEEDISHIVGIDKLTHHKPDPEVWLTCAEILEIDITNCLVIEDGFP